MQLFPLKIWIRGIVISFLLVTVSASAQANKAKPKDTSSSLSDGVYLGIEELKVLADDPHPAVFSLNTSWISGEGHKGYFRYRMNVYGKGVTLKDAPNYIDRIHACSYTLNLYDKGQFIIRRVSTFFNRTIADSGDVTAMTANDLTQMDLADYKNFLASQDWRMSWSCL